TAYVYTREATNASPSMVQYTTVNVTEEPPKDHIIWSIFNFAYMNLCCLGLVALIHSIKARDRKVVGDLEGAREYGSIASCFNMAATVFTCLIILFLFFFVLFAIKFPAGDFSNIFADKEIKSLRP
uniref:Dispanin subfamily A member 2b-like n=1 Tax=Stegastes partitus TaxID=144197 RepID=A0A3B5B5L2_9TELE